MSNWSESDLSAYYERLKWPGALPAEKAQPRQKYGAKPTVSDGIRFASKREAEVYGQLRALEATGKITGLELQPRFPMPCGIEYRADFRFSEDGKVRVVDVKGMATPVFKLKLKLMVYFFPDITVEVWR